MGSHFADVDNLARLDQKPLQGRLDTRMRVFAVHIDQNAANAPPLAFFDVVDQVHLARFFQQHLLGADVGKNVPLTTVEFF